MQKPNKLPMQNKENFCSKYTLAYSKKLKDISFSISFLISA
jgi:hypothetical protein